MFVVVMSILFWLMAYLAIWFTLRAHSLWAALLPGGITLMLNLYYANSEPLTQQSWQSGVAIGSLTSHRELIEIISSGDEDQAVAYMERHLQTGEQAVLGALDAARRTWQMKRQ